MFRRNKYNIDVNAANDTLQNVFKSLDKKPNTIPFDKLLFINSVNKTYTRACSFISVLLLLLILLSPLPFRSKEFTVSSTGVKQYIVILDHNLSEGFFTLKLSGDGINYNDIYARLDDGSFLFPSTIDEEEGIVVFPYESGSLNIFIPDVNGKVLHAVLSK
ncbi:MAG: hypothetical protein K6B28_01610 [Lachnospiraceae bacterium]|nr:hypothetical protein [Lachnospiraceae bacterium]